MTTPILHILVLTHPVETFAFESYQWSQMTSSSRVLQLLQLNQYTRKYKLQTWVLTPASIPCLYSRLFQKQPGAPSHCSMCLLVGHLCCSVITAALHKSGPAADTSIAPLHFSWATSFSQVYSHHQQLFNRFLLFIMKPNTAHTPSVTGHSHYDVVFQVGVFTSHHTQPMLQASERPAPPVL